MTDKFLRLSGRIIVFSILSLFMIQGCMEKKLKHSPLFWEPVLGREKIPGGYETYTVFLATSYYYLENVSAQDMRQLKKHFRRFGKSIGNENLAIWAKNPDNEMLSIELGKTYADRVNRWYGIDMEYYKGPYIVVLSNHPDGPPQGNDFAAVISLSNKSPKYIVEALDYLDACIRRGEISPSSTTFFDYWLDVKSWWERTDKEFLKEFIITVISAVGKRG